MVRVVEALANPSRPARRLLEMAEMWPDNLPDVTPAIARYRTQRQLQPEEVAKVATAYEAGASMKELAKQFDVDRTTILRRLQGLGLKTRLSKLEPKEVREAAELYRAGWTLEKIGKRYHVHNSTVRSYLLDSGVAMRARGRRGFDKPTDRELRTS